MKKGLRNVIILGLAFLCVFIAFQTEGNIQATILNSVKVEDKNFKGDGYTSLGIIYIFLAIFNWVAPLVNNLIGSKLCMICGAITYTFFVATFLWPQTWLLYLASAVVGTGAAFIWNGQGTYLTDNSNTSTLSRNSGIFWAILQFSFLIGNLFVFFQFGNQEQIPKSTRNIVISVLAIISGVGCIVFLFLPKAFRDPEEGQEAVEEQPKEKAKPWDVFKGAVKLFFTPTMLMLNVTFFYSGIAQAFYSGVYGTAIGNTLHFKSSKKLVGLNGVFIGVGEVLGGALFGILGNKTAKYGRNPIVIGGFIIHVVAFTLIFFNLPNNSPLHNTNDLSIITQNSILAIFCSFLLGFGDACYQTQFYTIIGDIYTDNTAPPFGIFKFTQSVAAAISFLYASHVTLQPQIYILVLTCVAGTVSYVYVEFQNNKIKRAKSLEASSTEKIRF